MNVRLGVSNIEKSYGKKKVLAGATYGFASGVTAVMGPNGCGKSTLLRICALLEPPTAGEVRYSYTGKGNVPHDVALRRKITYVLPEAALFNTTVWKNAAYGLMVRGVGRRERKKRTAEMLQAVGLYDKRKENALFLSSGEAQRLALVRAMVLEPEVLFLDEPTVNLDQENAAIVEKILLGMKKQTDAPTIILATHDRAMAERLADVVITIRHGKIPHGVVMKQGLDETVRGKKQEEESDLFINPEFFK
ncbi:MAG: ATP-binding cassette domain-containing protein [Nitrospirota bacterium]|jgi:tungstate transport system ATP-binding protein